MLIMAFQIAEEYVILRGQPMFEGPSPQGRQHQDLDPTVML